MNKRLGMFLLILLLPWSAWAEAPAIQVSMRDSGYTMGDFIDLRVEIPLAPGQTLDEESMPLTGRVRPWLDLRELRWQQNGDTLTLDLRWQLFATVEIAQRLHTPTVTLRTRDGKVLVIPAQPFHYSPALPYPLESSTRKLNLPPFKADERTPFVAAWLCLLLATGCGLAWLWIKDRIPWWPFRPGPMTVLVRSLRRLPSHAILQQSVLREMHAAFNRSAGESLYPNTLPKLFDAVPYLRNERTAISAFFDYSWRVFHADLPLTMRVKDVSDWAERCASSERLYRRFSRA